MENEIDRWYKRLWETKGSRFIAASRLELHEKWFTITINVVTVYIISLNLTILLPSRSAILSNENITFSTICLSVLVLVFSLILSSRNFKMRAERHHECGRRINEIYDKVCLWKSSKEKPNKDELQKMITDYYSILDKFENHIRLDYLVFKNNNLSEYKKNIKYPRLFCLFIRSRYFFNTMGIYWLVLFTPLFIYLIS